MQKYTIVPIKSKFCTFVVWLKTQDPTKVQTYAWMYV